MYPQYMFWAKKYENSQNISTENCHFYSREKSLYIAWACFRNGKTNLNFCEQKPVLVNETRREKAFFRSVLSVSQTPLSEISIL